jgi:hypothetical protein
MWLARKLSRTLTPPQLPTQGSALPFSALSLRPNGVLVLELSKTTSSSPSLLDFFSSLATLAHSFFHTLFLQQHNRVSDRFPSQQKGKNPIPPAPSSLAVARDMPFATMMIVQLAPVIGRLVLPPLMTMLRFTRTISDRASKPLLLGCISLL